MANKTKICEYCETENDLHASKCTYCHEWLIVDDGEWRGQSRPYNRLDPADLDQAKQYEIQQKYKQRGYSPDSEKDSKPVKIAVVLAVLFMFVIVFGIALIIPSQFFIEDDFTTEWTEDATAVNVEMPIEVLSMGWDYGVENDVDGILYTFEVQNFETVGIEAITIYTAWYDENGNPYVYIEDASGYLSELSELTYEGKISEGDNLTLSGFAALSYESPYGISPECAHPYLFEVTYEDGTTSYYEPETYWHSEYYNGGHPLDYVPATLEGFIESIEGQFEVSARLLSVKPVTGMLTVDDSEETRTFELEVYYYDPSRYEISGFITWEDTGETVSIEGYAYKNYEGFFNFEITTNEGESMYLSITDSGSVATGTWWSYDRDVQGTVTLN